MKLFIASDIHGSMHYCGKMLDAWKKENADRLVLLGDVLYHGPRNDLPEGYNPKAVIAALNEISDKILCVRGNCDTEVDQMVLEFPVLAEYSVIFDGDITMYLTHGHSRETLEKSLPAGSYLICGHTHVPEARECGGHTYINPGSVSIPKEGSQHGYIIYESRAFTWKNLEGEPYNILKAGDK
ncbi:MAG: phosphodiesterase [Clostridia bacterium]|nr:phosphodiesterase [Clostridia bacterium]